MADRPKPKVNVEVVKEWADFVRLVCQTEEGSIWRGQRDSSWVLASPFERQILDLAPKEATPRFPYHENVWIELGDYKRWQRDLLRDFVGAATGIPGSPDLQKRPKIERWSFGRHYGLTTPLLDWSYSPYIAAFFAVTGMLMQLRSQEEGWGFRTPGDASCAVFALDVTTMRLSETVHELGKMTREEHAQMIQEERDGTRRSDPIGLKPIKWKTNVLKFEVLEPRIHELYRLRGQRGLFTRLTSVKYFELESALEAASFGNCVTKYIIRDNCAEAALRHFKEHGIDSALLYPDLEGAARFANEQFKGYVAVGRIMRETLDKHGPKKDD